MQHFKIELIEHKRWRVTVPATNATEAIEKVKREQRAEQAFELGTRLEIIKCDQAEK